MRNTLRQPKFNQSLWLDVSEKAALNNIDSKK